MIKKSSDDELMGLGLGVLIGRQALFKGRTVNMGYCERLKRIERYLEQELSEKEKKGIHKWCCFMDHLKCLKEREDWTEKCKQISCLIEEIWGRVGMLNLGSQHYALAWLFFDMLSSGKVKNRFYYESCFYMGLICLDQRLYKQGVKFFEKYISMIDPDLSLKERKMKVLKSIAGCYEKEDSVPATIEAFAKKMDSKYKKEKYVG